ncbi:MAG TPA: NAD(P)-dependent oxidoreductase [Stellaceae bacterium]|jgi:3-hydroxyisobutyrate dehydrogenase-like beta-hydroxyacid dehydrogenase|nr:NAD(P)-dependent oxidoreductase [Stellaceae bacterium]
MTGAQATIAIIGLGAIGRPMAERIAGAGLPLVVCDVREAAVAGLPESVVRAASPEDAANRAEIVLACLPSIESHRRALTGTGGAIHGSRARIYIHTGTTGSALVTELAEAFGARGVATLDAPMTGGVPRARAGTLTVMASGPRAAFAAAEPFLRCYASTIVYLGERLGAAQVMKLINNMLSAANLAVASEAMVLGAKAGLDPEQMIAVLNAGTGQNSATLTKIPDHVLTRGFDYGGAMYITDKDLGAYAEEAAALAAPIPLGDAVRHIYREAAEAKTDDITTVARYFERLAGVELPKTR